VLNKLDLIPADERETQIAAFVKTLRWKGPVFGISAISGEGCRALVHAVQAWLDAHPAQSAVAATS
jgi:GTP-binding protein